MRRCWQKKCAAAMAADSRTCGCSSRSNIRGGEALMLIVVTDVNCCDCEAVGSAEGDKGGETQLSICCDQCNINIY